MTPMQEADVRHATTRATKGCWKVWSDEGQTTNGRHRYSVCVESEQDSHICIGTAFGDTPEQALANATLMAAAPVLHAELEAERAHNERVRVALTEVALASGDPGSSYESRLLKVLRALRKAVDVAHGVHQPEEETQ